MAVRPRLPRGPLDGVVSVAAFVLVGPKLSVGRVSPSDILHDDGVAARNGARKRRRLLERRALAVRRPVDKCREAASRGSQNVRSQAHAVAHRNRHVVFVNRRGRRLRRDRRDGRQREGQPRDPGYRQPSHAHRFPASAASPRHCS